MLFLDRIIREIESLVFTSQHVYCTGVKVLHSDFCIVVLKKNSLIKMPKVNLSPIAIKSMILPLLLFSKIKPFRSRCYA